MLKKSNHRFGYQNFNEIKQLNYLQNCQHKLDNKPNILCSEEILTDDNDIVIKMNEIILEELMLCHEPQFLILPENLIKTTYNSFYDNLCIIDESPIEHQIIKLETIEPKIENKIFNPEILEYEILEFEPLEPDTMPKTTYNSFDINLSKSEKIIEETPITKVSSQVEKMELVIQQQKIFRKLNRKNSW